MIATPTVPVIFPTEIVQPAVNEPEMVEEASPPPSSAGIWVGVILALALAAGGLGSWVTTNRIPK
jgi:hypothetical protein